MATGTPQPPAPAGVSTGGVYAPVKDAESRPITAGGFVDGAPVIYRDDTERAGLSGWVNVSGGPDKKYILEAPGAGVALLDFDGDGWQDIYLVNGSTFEAELGKAGAPRAALWRNNRDGTFTDVAHTAGVGNERWGFAAAVGDYNNDGAPDLYVANFGKNRLYRNNRDGSFTDIAEHAGVTVGTWSAGASFGDYDGDGDLDLAIAGYVKFDVKNPPVPGTAAVSGNFCQYRGQTVMCGPRGLPGERDFLFRNNGDGTFTEVAQPAGVADSAGYFGFGTAFADVSNDGRVDLLIANDSTPNYLYVNSGDGTFEEMGYASGFALNESGREQASMGLAIGDYNNDGRADLYVTNFSDDYNTLYKDEGENNYSDLSFQLGVGEPSIPFLGWGTGFLDFDNDGYKDIVVANGHVYRGVDQQEWGTTWKQRPLLFRNLQGKRFEPVPPATGSGLAVTVAGRGLAVGSLNNDGKLDVVLSSVDGPPTLLRNVAEASGNWIILQLVGGPKSPRDAIGATVFLTAGGKRQRGDVISGGSYASSSDLRVHFGLGDSVRIDELEIRWPSGEREKITPPGVNRIFTVTEGKGAVESRPKPR